MRKPIADDVPADRKSTSEAELCGTRLVFDALGALYLPEHSILCVSDLHLEKGAAFARRGQLLPPWDTLSTLRLLETALSFYRPSAVVCLGDNFHDRRGAELMPMPFRILLESLMKGREWIWILGNHDPDGVADLPGTVAEKIALGALHFTHEPRTNPAEGEIAGHLHPAATLRRRERSVRRPCFAMDARRLIMPSFGVMTGGLDLDNRAFRGLFEKASLRAHMLSQGRVHSFDYAALRQ